MNTPESSTASDVDSRPFAALGRRLKEIRTARGLTQEAMGHLLCELGDTGISADQSRISRWEKGSERPNRSTLRRYADLACEAPATLLSLANPATAEGVPPRTHSSSRRPSATVGLSIAVVFLSVLAGALFVISTPAQPTRAEIRDGQLTIFADDRELWSRPVPDDAQQLVEPLIVDLDGDGRREIVAAIDPGHPASWNGGVTAFSDRGDELWHFSFGRSLTIGDRSFIPIFVSHHLYFIDRPSHHYVLVIDHHVRWFPAQVVLLDPQTGEVVSEYWHPGFLNDFAIYDVGRDGSDQLLLSGVNNPGDGPGRASLAVLDLPFEPADGPDEVFGFVHARESAYLLFPRTDLHDISSAMAVAREMHVESDDRILVGTDSNRTDLLIYYLDANLAVADLRVADSFVREHDESLSHRYSPIEKQAWRKIDLFPRAPDANRLPSVTRPGG